MIVHPPRPEGDVVAALPAGGWRCRNRNTGEESDEPVVGWLVYKDGRVYPVIHERDGDTLVVDGCADDMDSEIYHPDRQTETENQ